MPPNITSVLFLGHWSSRHCSVKSKSKTWVECSCNHMSEYAVLAHSDDRTGYEIYFYVSCIATLVSEINVFCNENVTNEQ